MAIINANVRWADNTAELKANILQGIGVVDAMKASVDRTAASLGGAGLLAAANKVTAAIDQLGGVTKLTAAEQDKANTLLDKALQKYQALGLTAPQAMVDLYNATKHADDENESFFAKIVGGVAAGELLATALEHIGNAALAGFTAALEAVPNLVTHTIDLGNQLFEMSLKTGASVENLSALRYVASQTGLDFDAFGTTLFKMEQALGATGQKADLIGKDLLGLGLDMQTLKDEKPDQAFIDIMAALEAMPNRADQARIGVELFGKSFKDMAGLTQESITDLLKEANDLGLVMSTQTAAAAHVVEISWKSLSMQFEATADNIGATVLPALAALEQLATEAFQSVLKNGNDAKGVFADGQLQSGIILVGEAVIADTAAMAGFVQGSISGLKVISTEATLIVKEFANVGAALITITSLGTASENSKGFGGGPSASAAVLKSLHDIFDASDALNKGFQTAAGEVGQMFAGVEQVADGMAGKFGSAFDAVAAKIQQFADQSHKAFGGVGNDIEGAADKGGNAWKKAAAEINAVTDSTYATLLTLDGQVVAGAQYYLERGKTVEQLAIYYGTTKTQMQAVVDEEKFLASVTADTNKEFGKMLVTVPDLSGRTAEFQDVIDRLDGSIGVFHDGITIAGDTLTSVTLPTLLKLPDVVSRNAAAFDQWRHAAVDLSGTLEGSLDQALLDLPKIMEHAFEGGGGTSGAIEAFGVDLGKQMGKTIESPEGPLASVLPKSFDNVIGSALGGLVGGAVGSLISEGVNKLVSWIASLFNHVPDDLKRDAQGYGVQLSQSVMQGIQSDMNSLHLSETAATIFNASKLFPTVDATNFSQALNITHDAFSALARGELTATQANQVLTDMWPKLAQAGTSAIGVLNAKMVDLIKLDQQYGLQTQAITDYLKGQATSGASDFSDALSITSGAYDKLGTDQATLADLQAKLAKASAADQSSLQQQIQATTADIATQQGILAATAPASPGAASALGAGLAGTFNGLIAGGSSFGDAIKAIGSGVTSLGKILQQTGYDGGAAFNALKGEVDLYNDAVAGPALQYTNSLAKGIVTLGNTGQLTQDTFSGLGDQITGTFNSLVSQGKDGGAVLVAMQDPLQTLWEEEQNFGFKADDSTQALIDEGVQAGVVGEKHKSTTDQMIDALNHIDTDIQTLVTAFGVSLPGAIGDTAGAFAKIPKKVDVDVNTHYNDVGSPSAPDFRPDLGPDTSTTAHTGALVEKGRILQFHKGTDFVRLHGGYTLANDEVPAILQTGEAVLQRSAVQALGQKAVRALNAAGSGSVSAPTVAIQPGPGTPNTPDGGGNDQGGGMLVVQLVMDGQVITSKVIRDVKFNKNQAYTNLRGAIGLAS